MPSHPVATVTATCTLMGCWILLPSAQAQDLACAQPVPTQAPEPPESLSRLRSLATGSGVRVAVIDTGVAPSPELDQVIPGADLVTPADPNPLFDCDAHGTVVAGIIAGTTTGLAPDAEIIAIRQTSAHYRGTTNSDRAGSLETLAGAITNAVELQADVINISVVSCMDPADALRVDTSGLDGALERAEAEGVVVVAAAGNTAADCHHGSTVFPAHRPTVLSVGARSGTHSMAEYSIEPPEGGLQLSAPGHVEAVAFPTGSGWASGTVGPQGQALPFEGTSFAAPVVTGSIALLLERYPDAAPEQVRERVAAAAEPSGGAIDSVKLVSQLAPTQLAHRDPVVVEFPDQVDKVSNTRWWLLLGVLSLLGAAAAVSKSRAQRPRS